MIENRALRLQRMLDEAADGDIGSIRKMYEFVKAYMTSVDKGKVIAALAIGGVVGAVIALHVLTPYAGVIYAAVLQSGTFGVEGFIGGQHAKEVFQGVMANTGVLTAAANAQTSMLGNFGGMISGSYSGLSAYLSGVGDVVAGGVKGALALGSAGWNMWMQAIKTADPDAVHKIAAAVKAGAVGGAAVGASIPVLGGFITAWKKYSNKLRDIRAVRQMAASVETAAVREDFRVAARALGAIYG